MRKALAMAAVFTCFAVPVRADVPPIDQCSKVGEACPNAGNEGKTAGTCVKSTCTRLNKATGKSESYECTKCIEGPPPAPAKKSSGCAVGPPHGAYRGPAAIFAALLLVAARRRRAG